MDKRTEYVEKLSAQIVAWDVQIDLFKDKAESAAPAAKFEYAKLIAASDDDWEELKAGAEQIWNEVKDVFTDAVKKLR